jgi:hypothetical protein
MAMSDPVRREVFAFLQGEARSKLLQAAEAGLVPLAAVSPMLVERFGAEALRAQSMRPFIGIAVSAILEEEGFALVRTGVRLSQDPLFATGAMFERVRDEGRAPASHALLARFIDSLTNEELAFAEARIQQRLRTKPRRVPR